MPAFVDWVAPHHWPAPLGKGGGTLGDAQNMAFAEMNLFSYPVRVNPFRAERRVSPR